MAKSPRIARVKLGELVSRPGDRLSEEVRREGECYCDCDMTGADLEGATFDSCKFERVRARSMTWRAVHFTKCVMNGLEVPELEGVESSWRQVEVTTSRLGVLDTYNALWREVSVHDSRLGYVNLRGSKVTDVVLRGCVIDELDLGAAQVTRLALPGCELRSLRLHHARLADVDLTGATIHAVQGLGDLRGATISQQQLYDLAPHLAQHLGITVADE